MDFSSGDIRLLYGERFFLIEADEATMVSVPPKENTESAPNEESEVSQPETEASTPTKKLETPAVEEPQVELEAKPKPQPAPQAESEVSPPPLPLHMMTSGEAIVWKMRPTAQFVVVLQKQEFTNKELTGLLKEFLLKAEIAPALVGFGIIPDNASAIDLGSAEKPYVLLFDQLKQNWPEKVEIESKKVWPLATLSQCKNDREKTNKVLTALAAVKKLLN